MTEKGKDKGKKPEKGKGKDKRAYPIKGVVSAVDADSVTIEAKAHGRHEGGELDVLVGANTHITVNGAFAELSAVQPGLKAHAVCRMVGGAYLAKHLTVGSETEDTEEMEKA